MHKSVTRMLSMALVLALLLSTLPLSGAAGPVRSTELVEVPLENGDFENGNTGWSFEGISGEVVENSYSAHNATHVLNLWYSDTEAAAVSAVYTVTLEPGTYKFSFEMDGKEEDAGLTWGVLSPDSTLLISENTLVTTGWDAWQSFETGLFTLTERSEIRFVIHSDLQPAGYWGHLDNLKLFREQEIGANLPEIAIPNGDFENGNTGWSFEGISGEVVENSYSGYDATHVLNLWYSDTEAAAVSAAYSVKLTAGSYKFGFEMDGAAADSGLRFDVMDQEGSLWSSETAVETTGWDAWQSFETGVFTLEQTAEIRFVLHADSMPGGYWGHLDNLRLYGTGAIAPAEAEFDHTPTVAVERVNGVDSEDFMRGTDVSSYLSIINSGATFYDYEGNALDEQGFFDLLASAGFNYIRLRVWNDPFDAQGNGYGGGNCDLAAALAMGQWATNAGMQVLIDFHYSDFWADPGKQQVPKAWKGYTAAQKAEAVDEFTYNSLKTLLEGGVNVGMVQVGNETTGSICGESSWANKAQIFSAASAAVRRISAEFEHPILVAIHFTNPERSGNYASQAKNLDSYGVDYDVFASSWYPYWHGSTSNLTAVLKNVADTYGKKVVVAETSWAWTLEDGDGHDNTVRKNNNDSNNAYPFSQQGQADELVAAAKAVTAVGTAGVGVFYWENAWIPVQYAYDEAGVKDAAILASNKAKWEQFGSGWAASYAAEYDPNDAGRWFGGSAVDNQAMFDFHGKALDSLWTWRYMMAGTTEAVEQQIVSIEEPALTLAQGDALSLPATVQVTYLVGGVANEPVTWNETDAAAVDPQTPGVYTVRGTVSTQLGEREILLTVTVNFPNLLRNPGFELSDMSMYAYSGGSRTGDDPHSGSRSFHFYNGNGGTVELSQTLELEPGSYSFSLFAQGDTKSVTGQFIYVSAAGETQTQSFALSGWAAWQNPKVDFTLSETAQVTVGLYLPFGAGGWGTVDDLDLHKTGEAPEPDPVFSDVTDKSLYYYEPVYWALERGITAGTSETTFSPEISCTRAQAVTFLWRAMGSPEPTGDSLPFTDVKTRSYYYKAVAWAYENGVSSGMAADTFGVKETCTRSQIITMLWAAMGRPQPAGTHNPFKDVPYKAYYKTAVLWAVENGITAGTSADTFSPRKVCTRAEIVTFLWKAFKDLGD